MEQSEIRELLEQAAKAAGYKILGDWEYDESWGFNASTGHGAPTWWNPYHDDGDSRRHSLDAAVMHVVQIAYQQGIRDAQQAVRPQQTEGG